MDSVVVVQPASRGFHENGPSVSIRLPVNRSIVFDEATFCLGTERAPSANTLKFVVRTDVGDEGLVTVTPTTPKKHARFQAWMTWADNVVHFKCGESARLRLTQRDVALAMTLRGPRNKIDRATIDLWISVDFEKPTPVCLWTASAVSRRVKARVAPYWPLHPLSPWRFREVGACDCYEYRGERRVGILAGPEDRRRYLLLECTAESDARWMRRPGPMFFRGQDAIDAESAEIGTIDCALQYPMLYEAGGFVTHGDVQFVLTLMAYDLYASLHRFPSIGALAFAAHPQVRGLVVPEGTSKASKASKEYIERLVTNTLDEGVRSAPGHLMALLGDAADSMFAGLDESITSSSRRCPTTRRQGDATHRP